MLLLFVAVSFFGYLHRDAHHLIALPLRIEALQPSPPEPELRPGLRALRVWSALADPNSVGTVISAAQRHASAKETSCSIPVGLVPSRWKTVDARRTWTTMNRSPGGPPLGRAFARARPPAAACPVSTPLGIVDTRSSAAYGCTRSPSHLGHGMARSACRCRRTWGRCPS